MKRYFKHKIEKIVSVPKLVTIHYFELTKDFDYPEEAHDFCELHYVDKGHVFCYSDDKKFELSQGDLLFYKPMTRHRIVADRVINSNVCIISFECNLKVAEELQNTVFKLNSEEKNMFYVIYDEASKSFEPTKFNPAIRKMQAKNSSTLGSMQLIQISLEHLLINLLRRNSEKQKSLNAQVGKLYQDETVNLIIEYLNKNVFGTITLGELSTKIGYGTTFLCQRFKNVTGKSILKYFNDLKIEQAKKIIRENKNFTVSQISDSLSFCDPAYFCSFFKKSTGMSPKEYSRVIHAYDSRE